MYYSIKLINIYYNTNLMYYLFNARNIKQLQILYGSAAFINRYDKIYRYKISRGKLENLRVAAYKILLKYSIKCDIYDILAKTNKTIYMHNINFFLKNKNYYYNNFNINLIFKNIFYIFYHIGLYSYTFYTVATYKKFSGINKLNLFSFKQLSNKNTTFDFFKKISTISKNNASLEFLNNSAVDLLFIADLVKNCIDYEKLHNFNLFIIGFSTDIAQYSCDMVIPVTINIEYMQIYMIEYILLAIKSACSDKIDKINYTVKLTSYNLFYN